MLQWVNHSSQRSFSCYANVWRLKRDGFFLTTLPHQVVYLNHRNGIQVKVLVISGVAYAGEPFLLLGQGQFRSELLVDLCFPSS